MDRVKKICSVYLTTIALLLYIAAPSTAMQASTHYTLTEVKIGSSDNKAVSSGYILDSVEIGSIFAGKIQSTNYNLEAVSAAPGILEPPTVNDVTTPTNSSMQTLSGTKKRGTSIYINGNLVVILNSEVTWSCDIELAEGNNELSVTLRNGEGRESEPVYVNILLDATAPTITLSQPQTPINQDVSLSYTVSDNNSAQGDITVTGDESPYTQEGSYSVSLTATDEAGNTIVSNVVLFVIDKTAPEAVVVTDDGESTSNATQLHAVWTTSSDNSSGIGEYQYAIGTSPAGTDIVDWTSAALNTDIDHAGLNMAHGQAYYISVRVLDNAGNISQIASSDGIFYGIPPDITDIVFSSQQNFHQGWPITIHVDAIDAEGDTIEYRYLANGSEIQSWTTDNEIDWIPSADEIGSNTIGIEVRASGEVGVAEESSIYIFRKPITPQE